MKTSSYRNMVFRWWPLAIVILAIPAVTSGSPPASSKRVVATRTIAGTPCHGANVFNGQQVATWDDLRASWGPDVPQATKDFWNQPFAFREVGVQGSSGALGIDANTPLDSIMVNYLSPENLAFLAIAGWPAATGPDVENRPIHDPLTWVNNSLDRGGLPAAHPSVPKYIPVRNTTKPVTLRQWNSARGTLRLTCYADGTGHADFRGQNFLPRRPHTFWAIHAATTAQSLAARGPLLFWALGGVPASAIADDQGNLHLERDLHYCPLDLDDPFMYLGVYPHWDGSVWGNQPNTFLFDGFGPGNSASIQLCLPVGEHLLDR
jgi:hypothetical protein